MRRPLALLVLGLVLIGAVILIPTVRGRLAARLQPPAAPPTPATETPAPTEADVAGLPTALTTPASSPTADVPATPLPAPLASTQASTATPRPSAPPAPSPTHTPPPPTATPAPIAASYSYPVGRAGQPLGDGFIIRHGLQVENTWYNPGHWHAGEDWYALEGDTGGAQVFAVAAGEVVYAGANYPGRVVLIAHPDGLVSMYGHLDPNLAVAVGDRVVRGQLLGTVLTQVNARAPSHLHFEIRSFVTADPVNGNSPRYGYRCGVNCPPGPGYWPIGAPDLPADQGWHNPTHVIARRMAADAMGAGLGEVIVAAKPISPSVTLWSGPPDDPERRAITRLDLEPGERFPLRKIWAGEETPRETSALAYQLWYEVRLNDGTKGWVEAAVATAAETGSDGRPSSIGFNFFPTVEPAPG